ncbi:MAG: DUF177 domain-containing protein [Bdellovibrionota bacterium]
MKIYLNEIGDTDTDLEFTQEEAWVKDTIKRADEVEATQPNLGRPGTTGQLRQANVTFTLRKVDEVVVLSGHVKTQVELLCSRCATQFQYPVDESYSGLFCRDPDMAGVAHLQKSTGDEMVRVGQNKGFARHAHNFENEHNASRDLDITYLSHDYIDLSDVLMEQLQLQIPFQPLCEKGCKGICTQCGADLNRGRCACDKILKSRPFAALGDIKS